MFIRLETDKCLKLNGLRNHRSAANNTISALVQIAEASLDTTRIWSQVENDFVRLAESPTKDIRILTPVEAFAAAKALEKNRIKDVAAAYGRHENDINRYRGILGASLTLTLIREGLITQPFTAIDQSKYQQLKKLHEEASAIAYATTQPQVAEQLALMPDLGALLDSFRQYSTVRLFLEENGVPYQPRSTAFFNADLRDYLFGKKIPRMGLILRRATLSRWINQHTNWYGLAECEIDENVSKSAEFIYSKQYPKGSENRVRRIKWFLNEIITQELAIAQEDIAFSPRKRYSLYDIFVPTPKNGPLNSADDINLPKTFRLYAKSSACPELIKSIVRKYLGTTSSTHTYPELASDIYKDLAYALVTKKRWLEGGFTFLENVLLLKPGKEPSWSNLLVERRKMLRKFRAIFQKALHQ